MTRPPCWSGQHTPVATQPSRVGRSKAGSLLIFFCNWILATYYHPMYGDFSKNCLYNTYRRSWHHLARVQVRSRGTVLWYHWPVSAPPALTDSQHPWVICEKMTELHHGTCFPWCGKPKHAHRIQVAESYPSTILSSQNSSSPMHLAWNVHDWSTKLPAANILVSSLFNNICTHVRTGWISPGWIQPFFA